MINFGSGVELENVPLLARSRSRASPFRLVVERWYVLGVMCLLAFVQGLVWNSWGPIATVIKPQFHWSDGTIALLANWGPICYLLAVLPSSWLLDTKGLRASLLFCSSLLLFGAAVRCLTLKLPASTVLIHTGQFFNGLAGPIAMSAPPVLSATWFPAGQRTVATSIMAAANYLGSAAAFIWGPQMIKAYTDETGQQARLYMLYETLLAGILFAAVLVHLPDRPLVGQVPVSLSSTTARTSFWLGLRQLFRHKGFWILGLAYGSMTGVYSGWSAFLAPNLENFLSKDKAENESAWLGFYATLAGCIGGVGLAVFTDQFAGKMKMALCVFCIGSSLCAIMYLWFALACLQILPNNTVYLYLSCVIGGFLLNGTIPLFYEAAVEGTFPIAEGVTTCLLTTLNNIGCLIFLFVPMIPHIGNAWANWMLVASCGVSFLACLFYPEKYARLKVDSDAMSAG